MKTYFTRTALIISALLMAMITIAQSETELKSKIEEMNKVLTDSYLAGNFDEYLVHYAPDAISMPNYGEIRTPDDIKKKNSELKEKGLKVSQFDLNIESVKDYGDMVAEIGTFKQEYKMADMDMPKMEEGKYLTLYNKEADGSLKIMVEIWNANEHPAHPAEKTAMDESGEMDNN